MSLAILSLPAHEGLCGGEPCCLGTSAHLAGFAGSGDDADTVIDEAGLSFHLAALLLLMDWTGRQQCDSERGAAGVWPLLRWRLAKVQLPLIPAPSLPLPW